MGAPTRGGAWVVARICFGWARGLTRRPLGRGKTPSVADDADLQRVQQVLREARVSADDFGVFGSGSKVAGIPGSRFDYRAATPVLIRVLPELNDPEIREAVVRSLSTSAAKPSAVPVLLAEFCRTSNDSEAALKWAVGNALETTADQASVDALVPLVLDPTHGRGRQMIVSRLGRAAKDPRIVEALLDLIDDPDVALHRCRRYVVSSGEKLHVPTSRLSCEARTRRFAPLRLGN